MWVHRDFRVQFEFKTKRQEHTPPPPPPSSSPPSNSSSHGKQAKEKNIECVDLIARMPMIGAAFVHHEPGCDASPTHFFSFLWPLSQKKPTTYTDTNSFDSIILRWFCREVCMRVQSYISALSKYVSACIQRKSFLCSDCCFHSLTVIFQRYRQYQKLTPAIII